MSLLRRTNNGMALFWCPGCDIAHGVRIERAGDRPLWTISGPDDSPTIHPSVVVRDGVTICHSWVRDGYIEFLKDSTHFLAGQLVPLPPWDL